MRVRSHRPLRRKPDWPETPGVPYREGQHVEQVMQELREERRVLALWRRRQAAKGHGALDG